MNASDHPAIHAQSGCLDATAESWDLLAFPVHAGYKVVIPLPYIKILGIKILMQPLYCPYLGVFCLPEVLNSLQAVDIPRVIQKHFKFIHSYHFHPANGFFDHIGALSFKENHQLHPQTSFEAIRSDFHKSRKWRINQASKSGLLIKETNDISLLTQMFKRYLNEQIDGGITAPNLKKLSNLVHFLQKQQSVRMLRAILNGEVLAINLVIYNASRAVNLISVSSEKGKNYHAMSLIMEDQLKHFAAKDIIFDFEGSHIPGIASFYGSFGAETEQIPVLERSFWYKVLLKARKLMYW